MTLTLATLYTTALDSIYFLIQEEGIEGTMYRVCWAARINEKKLIANECDWCYVSGEYRKLETAKRRISAIKQQYPQGYGVEIA